MNPTERDIRTLRENIEETRERISGEMEEIGNRLTPEHARDVTRKKMARARDRAIEGAEHRARAVADTTVRTGRRVGETLSDNPIPAAMVGIGAGWLLWNTLRPERERLAERVAETETGRELSQRAEEARERARERSSSMRERLGSATTSVRYRARASAETARERGVEIAERGGDQARRTWDRTSEGFDANPLAFGVAALVIGAGLGMMLPHTQREDRLLGARREQVVDRARRSAEEAKEVAIHSAQEGMRAARETAREEAEHREELPPRS
jgi:hypothetical protein